MTTADLLLVGGAVHTLDPARPRASGLAVADGRVLAVGDAADLADLRGPRTRLLDLRGRAVLPGFVDAHVHFLAWSLRDLTLDLDAAPTLEAGLAAVRDAAARVPAGGWLRGRGWDRNRWGRLPTAADLDRVTGDRPAALTSHDGHAIWLNTAGLRAAGFDAADAPTPSGGVVERDAAGRPSGVVFERACDVVYAAMPPPTEGQVDAALRAGLARAASLGLCGVHSFEDSHALAALAALDRAGDLPLRVYHGVARAELAAARDGGLRSGFPPPGAPAGGPDPRLRVGPLKLFADGALGSRTASLLAPYEGRAADGYRGVPTLSPADLRADLSAAADAGLDVAIHAIGDAAVREVLDAVADTRRDVPGFAADRLVRVEHAQLVDPEDVPRFAALGVVASMQPSHAAADWRTADAHWGPRARHGYAWRGLLAAGATLAFGTDAPVEPLDPLFSLYVATTRRDARGEPAGGWYPEQAVSLLDAVRAYSVGSAFAERAAGRRGTLAPGMDADLVVLASDPFAAPPTALLDNRVHLTVVGGQVVYDAGAGGG